jgi:hypothetical protein
MKYVAYIAILSTIIVLVGHSFPETVVHLMFGKAYQSLFLLWKYVLVTLFFAIANIFAYYFLSNEYIPVVVSALIGLTQIVLIVLFHNSCNKCKKCS